MTNNELYRMANSEISVSEAMKTEILRAANSQYRNGRILLRKKRLAALMAAVLSLALVCGIIWMMPQVTQLPLPKPSESLSGTTLNEQNENKVYFNPMQRDVFDQDKIKLFEVAGNETLKFDSLPKDIQDFLPVPPQEYISETDGYHVLYSTGWREFMIDGKFYHQKSGESSLYIGGGKRAAEVDDGKNPLLTLKPSVIGETQTSIYLMKDEEELSAYRMTEAGAVYFIVGSHISERDFLSAVEQSMK
ncbi:MAG: hypothetical protein LBT44_02910 [Clostridiales bacterium]|nr:hypothetical protein [Clostridiales bacterium]